VLLAKEPMIQVVGEAADGQEAASLARVLRPDVITMDVKMPRMNGIDAIIKIMAEAPSRILVVCSTSEPEISFRAIQAGALEVIAKPSSAEEFESFGRRLCIAIKLMSEIPVVRRRGQRPKAAPTPIVALDAFALAASTGGPAALAKILGGLPKDLPIPIFMAQHLARGFGAGFARWLSTETPLRVVMVEANTPCVPGCAYLASDGFDLVVGFGGTLSVKRSDDNRSTSADVLFASVARVYGHRVGAALLTGMGEDGAAGLLEIRKARGVALAQDEATSVVFGMPRAALLNGAVTSLIALDEIAPTIIALATSRRTL
jgi:two-component system chemotaxis response regulator CheB